MAPSATAHRREQISYLYAEGVSDPLDIHERHVAFAPLDAPDVGAVETTSLGELLLRPAPLDPKRTDPGPEAVQDVPHSSEG